MASIATEISAVKSRIGGVGEIDPETLAVSAHAVVNVREGERSTYGKMSSGAFPVTIVLFRLRVPSQNGSSTQT